MKCFYHHENDAVGICKSCAKALCPACVAETAGRLACLNRCEEDVRAVHELVQQNMRVTRSVSKGLGRFGSVLFFFVCGLVFAAGGWFEFHEINLVVVLGGCFILYAMFTLIRILQVYGIRRLKSSEDEY